MKITSVRARLMASSMIGGLAIAAIAATTASAQTAPAGTEVEGVVVTGSRIPQPNLQSVSPIQVVTGEEFHMQGQTDTVDLLNDLPQVFQNDVSSFSSTSNPLSGPGGVANVDLRGLGPQRTLVLVDGRRLGVGDPNTGNTNPSADINQIPAQLISRVDVLTGGASAAYGSDAIAGVVNFVMRRNFSGLQIDAQYGEYQHTQHNELAQHLLDTAVRVGGTVQQPRHSVWDGAGRDVNIVFGMNSADGNGNITGYLGYHQLDPVKFSERDWAACQIDTTNPPRCTGSSNSNIFYTSDGNSNAFAVLGHSFIPSAPGAPQTTPPFRFNSNPYEYLLHGDTRYTGGFFAHYEINTHFDAYGDFMFMQDRASTQVAPSALFQGSGSQPSGGFLVNCNNPLMSAQQQGTFCTPAEIAAGTNVDLTIGRRNIEGGPRESDYQHTNYRMVLGTRGEIAGPWRYDVYGSYYYTSFNQLNTGYLSIARLQNALQVGGTAANPVCLSGGSCVPYNIFQDGGVTPAALAYLNASASETGSVTETVLEGTVTGDLGHYNWKSPWANDGLGVAFGATHRSDHVVYTPDESSLSGDLSGFGGASTPINSTLRVNEYYAELRAPLIQDRTFAHEVLLEAGYRRSDYSSGINADTYKVGLQWAPVQALRFRASYQSAIRAPSVLELFSPSAVTNTQDPSIDPCAGAAPTASLAQCQNTGVTAAQYGHIAQCPAGQCAILLGGNPNLQAEQAKTYSIGLTFAPRGGFLDGFVGSVDYYDIKTTNLIGALPGGLVLNQCLTTGNPVFCNLVTRNPVNGTMFGTAIGTGYIIGTNVNIGAGHNAGIDVQANYRLSLDRFGLDSWGRLAFQMAGSYMLHNETTSLPGGPTYDCAGLYGNSCQTLNPRWRSNMRVTWFMPWHLETSINWRYFGAALLESESNQPVIGGGPHDPLYAHLPARNYIDLTAIWTVHERYVLRAGVTNVFDQDPPMLRSNLPGTGLPNTYSSYDLLGRHFFVGATATF